MPPPPEDALDNADAVFSGEVVKVIENKGIMRGYGNIVHFKVDKAWKGTEDSEMIITTGYGGGDCGISFEEGQQYLVYASASDMYEAGTLSTTICHRTTGISGATEDLNALGEGREVGSTHESRDEKESSFPWWAFAIFIVGLIFIFIGFQYKKLKKNASS